LPVKAKFADVGTGAGLPSIPCVIARADLRGVLIESKIKKAMFLEKVLVKCNLASASEFTTVSLRKLKCRRTYHSLHAARWTNLYRNFRVF
jgi:16S rRNA G527 N7-methylase RsmG